MSSPYLLNICSGKGGVGKSFIAANLAFMLAAHKQKTLLIDADIMFPNIHLMLGIDSVLHLDDWIVGRVELEKIITRYSDNLYVLYGTASGSIGLDGEFSFTDLYHSIILCTDFDFIVVDTSAGVSNHLLECASLSDKICLVATDEPTSIVDAYGVIKILKNYVEPRKINLLLNNIIDDEDSKDIVNKINIMTRKYLDISIDLLETILYDTNVRRSIIEQELLTISQLNSPSIKRIKSTAEKLLAIKHISK